MTWSTSTQILVGAAILAGRRVGIRIEPTTLQPRDYDQSLIAADDPHNLLDHLSQITWCENVARQLSLDKVPDHGDAQSR
jgi:hypothetical protein